MNNDTNEACVPPPLPEAGTDDPTVRATPAHLRNPLGLGVAAACAALAADAAFWTPDWLYAGPGGYGFALATLLAAGALAAARRDLDFRRPEWALLALTLVASALAGSGLSLPVALALLLLAARRSESDHGGTGRGLTQWVGALHDAAVLLLSKIFRGRARALGAAIAVGVFFLVLLTWGNAALALYVKEFTRTLPELVDLSSKDMARFFLWLAGILAFGVLAAPARKRTPEGIFVETADNPAPVALAVLVGANLAFLASNLVDTYWLGWMRRAPDGVSTTEYLYDGAYALMLDAAIAGALLLRLFRADGAARGDRRARVAGLILAGQCAWLGLGVAGRLALQMEKFGFTPARLWGVVFLVWGFIGLYGVFLHLRTRPSFRAFTRLAGWSALGALSLLQFRPPAVLSVDLNLALFASRPEWRFDAAYYGLVGEEGWRLSHAIATAEPHTTRGAEEGARAEHWRDMIEGRLGLDRPGCAMRDWRVRSVSEDALVQRYLAECGKTSDNAAR